MSPTYPVTLYYDRSCPLCSHEMNKLKEHDHENKLILVDCSAADFAPPPGGAQQAQMMQLLHARTASGEWVVGVPAFRLAYAGVGFTFVSDWLDKPHVMRLLNRLYPLIARNRNLIPGWMARLWFNWLARQALRRSQSCAKGQCSI